MPALAMFPLGTVLFPSAVLPLHVFEPRYRTMVEHCLAGNGEFGVVMIERGSEVGGGDVRSGVGTVAGIVQHEELDDGRSALISVGSRRIRINRWLPDDPYPRAEVEDWLDHDSVEADASALVEVVASLRKVLAWNAELGRAAPAATVELSDDPTLGSYQAAAVAPLSTMDRQALLAAESVSRRLEMLQGLLADELHFMAREFEINGESMPAENPDRNDEPGGASGGT